MISFFRVRRSCWTPAEWVKQQSLLHMCTHTHLCLQVDTISNCQYAIQQDPCIWCCFKCTNNALNQKRFKISRTDFILKLVLVKFTYLPTLLALGTQNPYGHSISSQSSEVLELSLIVSDFSGPGYWIILEPIIPQRVSPTKSKGLKMKKGWFAKEK